MVFSSFTRSGVLGGVRVEAERIRQIDIAVRGTRTLAQAQQALRDAGFPTRLQTIVERRAELRAIADKQGSTNRIRLDFRPGRESITPTRISQSNRFRYRGTFGALGQSTGIRSTFNFDFGSDIALTRRQILDEANRIATDAQVSASSEESGSEPFDIDEFSIDTVLEFVG